MTRPNHEEPHWATLVSAGEGTPTYRLRYSTESFTPLVNWSERDPSGTPVFVTIWFTQLQLRPKEALIRVDDCDECQVLLRRTGRQGRQLQPGEEVVIAEGDVVLLRLTDKRLRFGCVLRGGRLLPEVRPPELRWRFEPEESMARAMAMLCDSTPWLGFLSRVAPEQCSLDAQTVLLRVSTAALPVLAKAATLEGESDAQEGSSVLESDSQCKAESGSVISTPSQPGFAPAGNLLSSPAPKECAGNGKRKRE